MNLFQYWDQPTPPNEIVEWTDGFRRDNPEFEYQLFDEASALDFVMRHFGARHAAAFKACAVPAMQSDYFRLCALDVFGGIYVDADNQSLRPLSGLIDRAPHALIFEWLGQLNNGFLMFREPRDPFVRACLALVTDNIENRRFSIGFMATGPGVVNAIRCILEPSTRVGLEAAFADGLIAAWGFSELLAHAERLIEPTDTLLAAYGRMTQLSVHATAEWIGAQQPAYKQTDRHWLLWKDRIYR